MKPRLAVFKFASCDGCQLQFVNAEAELLTLARQVDVAYFPEVRSRELRAVRHRLRRGQHHHPRRRAAHPEGPGGKVATW